MGAGLGSTEHLATIGPINIAHCDLKAVTQEFPPRRGEKRRTIRRRSRGEDNCCLHIETRSPKQDQLGVDPCASINKAIGSISIDP